jgi:rhomboid protease GluP
MHKTSKHYLPTYTLIALNIAIYILTSIISNNLISTSQFVILQYGQVNVFVIEYGWYWQLFTSMFIHVNIVHLFGNMMFLLIFGLRAEEFFDLKEYLLIYFLSGIAGNLLTLLLPGVISAGASGAIFGVFGASVIYLRRTIGQSIMTALVYAFFLFFINSGPGVNIMAHLGGLIVGLLIGYILGTRRKLGTTYSYRVTYAR